MKSIFRLVLVIFVLSILECDNGGPGDVNPPTTTLSTISEITFGTRWNEWDSTVSDTGRIFSSGTATIFYQIKFDSVLGNWFVIRNEWRRNDTLQFSAVSLIPIHSKRICGELRHYYSQPLEAGEYKISVFYYNVDSSAYVRANYKTGVNSTFTIQQ